MSAQLTFAITNQIIKRTDHFRPAALSQNYLRAGFTFSEDWDDDADKIAIFTTQCGRSYEVILDENDECGVPWEVLTSPGYFFVSAYSGDRITATKASVYVEPSGYVDDPTATSDPSIDIYTQLQELIEERTSEEGIGAIVLQYLEDHPPEAPVQSVNGETGDVVLDAADVGALPDDTPIPTKLPNPSKLTFTGAVSAEYDGSSPVTVNIPSGGGGGAVDSVNGKTGVVVLDAEDVGALPDNTAIPDETTVAGWGFTKNTGTYSKPSSGIPKSDLASGVQDSLDLADTAIQSHQSLAGYATEIWVGQQGFLTSHQDISGKANVTTVVSKTSADTSQTLAADTFYVWPEMTALTITCPVSGMYAFRFTSGSTPTTLTMTGITMPDGFTVEADKVYEINVYNGYGVAQSWSVS